MSEKIKMDMEVFPQWESLIKRAKQEIDDTIGNNRNDGVALVTMTIAFTSRGRPIAWVVNSGKRVEPSSGARDLIVYLAQDTTFDTPE